jgi:hypothetical protein
MSTNRFAYIVLGGLVALAWINYAIGYFVASHFCR